MALTEVQNEIYKQIVLNVRSTQRHQIIYISEWLGWLPYGVYHWVNDCNEKDITRNFPKDWSSTDIYALESEGLLIKIDEWKNPKDDFDHKITYDVILPNN
jgi:hypothetical protein